MKFINIIIVFLMLQIGCIEKKIDDNNIRQFEGKYINTYTEFKYKVDNLTIEEIKQMMINNNISIVYYDHTYQLNLSNISVQNISYIDYYNLDCLFIINNVINNEIYFEYIIGYSSSRLLLSEENPKLKEIIEYDTKVVIFYRDYINGLFIKQYNINYYDEFINQSWTEQGD